MKRSFLLVPVIALFLHSIESKSQKLYWSEGNQIRSANLDGSSVDNVFTDATNPPDNFELDIDNELIFYRSEQEDLFYASIFDGSGKQSTANYGSFAGFTDFDIIPANEYIFMNFWQEGNDGGIDRTDYYNTAINSLPLNNPYDITDEEFNAITTDRNNEYIFFSVPLGFPGIYRDNMSGSSWTLLAAGAFGSVMEFDNFREKLYYTNSTNDQILRMNSNGSSQEIIVTTINPITSMSINELDGSIYWIEGNEIKRAEYDGTNITTVIPGLSSPLDIEIYLDPGNILVTNTNDSGPGSLRAAIEGANIVFGNTTIRFDIPGPGPHIIQPNVALPAITNTITIDGYTQPGASQNMNTADLNSDIRIVIDGQNIPTENGFEILADNSEIKGLSIINFANGNAIEINADNANVNGNFIGITPDGTTEAPNNLGILVSNASAATIGGDAPNLYNLISSNTTGGIHVNGVASTGNKIQGNFIGTDNSGNNVVSGGDFGIQIENASDNTIGGSTGTNGNIIVNQTDGIIIQRSGATDNIIHGNFIGTNSLFFSMPNTSTGIYIFSDANGNEIGGIGAGEGNSIAFNQNHGILIEGAASDNNTIRGNLINCSFSDNIFLGSGANNNLNAPAIGFVSSDSISGTSSPNAQIDIFRDYNICTTTGSNEYVISVTANGSGFWFYSAEDAFYSSEKLVATATDINGNSSPFSTPITVPLGFSSAAISANNKYIDLEFQFGAYGNAASNTAIGINDLEINFDSNGGSPMSFEIIAVKNPDGTDIGTATDLSGGESIIRVFINVTSGFPTGVERLSFNASNNVAIFDEGGVSLLSSTTSPEVILNPAPRINNTIFDFDICSGVTTNTTLQSNIPGSTFTWTASSPSTDVSGFSASGTANPIQETIINTGANVSRVTYTVTPIFNEIEGPEANFTFDITPLPEVIANPISDTICSGTAKAISLTSSLTTLTSFSWTASGPANISGYNNSGGPLINQVLTNTGNALGNVTYSITPTANGCAGNPFDVVIGVKPIETISFTSTDTNICNDETTIDLDVEVEGITPGQWSVIISDGTNDIPVSGGSFSPFTITDLPVTNNSTSFEINSAISNTYGVGCPMDISGTDVTITKLEEISVTSPISDTVVCETVNSVNIPLEFTGNGPWNITYSYNNITSTSTIDPSDNFITVSPVIVGTNTLQITDVVDVSASDCPGSANVTVEINKVSLPTATLNLVGGGTSTSICQGEEINLEFALTGLGPWEVVLLRGSTPETIIFEEANSQIVRTVTGIQDFAYTIQSVTSTVINCSGNGFGMVNVNVVPLPSTPTINALTGRNSVCEGEEAVAYSVLPINNASSYQWSFSNGVTHASPTDDDNSNSIFADFPEGIDVAEITVAGENGCGTGSAITLPVQVNRRAANPEDIQGPDNICQGTTNVTYNIPVVGNATGYVWYMDYNNELRDQKTYTANPTLNVNFNSGFEGAELTVAAYNNCDTSSARSSLTIIPNTLPGKAMTPTGPSVTCADIEITITVDEIEGANQYEWIFPAVLTPVDGSNITTSNSITINTGIETNIQNINVTGINECGTGLRADDPLRISVQTSPEIQIDMPESAYVGEEVVFTGVENTGQEIVDWQWNFGDGSSGFGTSVRHTYSEGGTYQVSLTAANDSDCEITASGAIEVSEELPVTIMNVITANGDGRNDGLFVEGINLFPNNEIVIMNRVGSQVLKFENYSNNWQEVNNGTTLEPGNYVVIFKVKGTNLSKKQTVSVLN